MLKKEGNIKKWSKKIISLIIIFLIVLSTSTSVCAATNNSQLWILKEDRAFGPYIENIETGEKIVAAMEYDEKGNLVELDLEKYVIKLNNEKLLNNQLKSVLDLQSFDENQTSVYPSIIPIEKSTSVSFPVTWYRYNPTFHSTYYKSASKVTSDYVGPASISYATSITSSESFSANANLSGEKGAIRGGAGFTWSTTTTSSTSITGTFTVPSGYTGYVTFSPKFNLTMGHMVASTYLDGYLIEETITNTSASCPVTLGNGVTDGVYRLVIY